MGPNPVWLMELLTEAMDLRSGQRVLDLGCGRAATSIFLAREFGVQVWATDLWINASDNWSRIEDSGLGDSVFPIHADARTLPFADRFFDAIVSVDAYHYFGTDGLYLDRCVRLLRPGGQLGIVSPGLRRELEGVRPPHLEMFEGGDLATLHTPRWWRDYWAITGHVEVLCAEPVPDASLLWRRWDAGCLGYGRATGLWPQGPPGVGVSAGSTQELRMLDQDGGALLDLVRVVARRCSH
jgi:cyclopropane fatty-acyl-phospholipid synthase-like methyltransferase